MGDVFVPIISVIAENFKGVRQLRKGGAPLSQLVECRTLDRKVVGLNLNRGRGWGGVVLCP